MLYIYKNRQIAISWTILREKGVLEDFSDSYDLSCFLIPPSNERRLVSFDLGNPLYLLIPYEIDEGCYSLELIWRKNASDEIGRTICRTRVDSVFTVTSDSSIAEELTSVCKVYIKSLVAIYGYDGLDAYQLAVLHRKTTLSEAEWLLDKEQRIANLEQTVREGALNIGAYPMDAFPTFGNTGHVVSSDGVYKLAENMEYVKSNNLCDPSTCVDGNLSPVTGEIRENTAAQDYKTTDFIPVTSGKTYVSSIDGALSPLRFVAYYDSAKTFLSCLDSMAYSERTYVFTVPDGCSFVRITPFFDPTKNNYQIEQGDAPSAYKEYANGYKVTTKKLLDGSVTVQKFHDKEIKDLFNSIQKIKTFVWDIPYRQLSLALSKGTIISDTNASELIFHQTTQVPTGDTSFRVKRSDLPFVVPFDTYFVRSTKEGEYYIRYATDSVSLNLADGVVSLNMLDAGLQLKINSNDSRSNYNSASGTLANGQQLLLPSSCAKTYKRIDFSCSLSKQDEWAIVIGHGMVTDYTGSSIRINEQGVTSYVYYGSELSQKQYDYPFVNFAVGSDIAVSIYKEVTGYNATLIIQSGGKVFKQNIRWIGDVGNVYATCGNATLSGCSLSFTPFKSRSDVWLFGDSYISLGDPKRWAYYLMADGYIDLYMCGYSGAKSASVFSVLSTEIRNNPPKYLVWCLGMNDKDNPSDSKEATSLNANWLSATKQLLVLCKQRCITPILATIPTVKGASSAEADSGVSGFRNHSKKNEWVKNSGYRYIDFAASVNADDTTGEWGDGYLSADGVHPTEEGAKALYSRVLLDFPEIKNCKPY